MSKRVQGEKEVERERKKNEVEGAPRVRLGCGIIKNGGGGREEKRGHKRGYKKTTCQVRKELTSKNVKYFPKFFFFPNSRS